MHSLKVKLVVAISVLIFILFGMTSFLFLNEKANELTDDIFVNMRSYAELTASKIVADYNLYLPQKSFVYFNREIKDLFSRSEDLASIQIVNYSGEIVYDSVTESEKQYEGAKRFITEESILAQAQAKTPSVGTLETERIVYLKPNEQLGYLSVDQNEVAVTPIGKAEKISYLVQPGSNEFSVIYYISYEKLQARLNETLVRGILLAVFGVGLGILISYMFAVGITGPLKKLTLGVGIIARGDFQHRVVVKTKDEIATLAHAFNSMAKELEIGTKALVYKERVGKELELAAKIQKELLPKTIPKVRGLDIAAGLLPAEEIGGDCYDFIQNSPNNLLMYLGDVTGHGVPSGIVVSIANALIYNFSNIADLKTLLNSVNKILKVKTSANMFITLVLLHWDADQNRLKYVSAGHEQMIHYHAKDKKVTLAPAGGLALGMLPNIEKTLNEVPIDMEEGDVVVAYSDGIPEAWKSETEMYGMGRLKRSVTEYSDLPSSMAIRNAMLSDVKEFMGPWKQMDDITLLVLKKNSSINVEAGNAMEKTVTEDEKKVQAAAVVGSESDAEKTDETKRTDSEVENKSKNKKKRVKEDQPMEDSMLRDKEEGAATKSQLAGEPTHKVVKQQLEEPKSAVNDISNEEDAKNLVKPINENVQAPTAESGFYNDTIHAAKQQQVVEPISDEKPEEKPDEESMMGEHKKAVWPTPGKHHEVEEE